MPSVGPKVSNLYNPPNHHGLRARRGRSRSRDKIQPSALLQPAPRRYICRLKFHDGKRPTVLWRFRPPSLFPRYPDLKSHAAHSSASHTFARLTTVPNPHLAFIYRAN